MARARRLEAEQLETYAIAAELAKIRAMGEAGHTMMNGDSNKFFCIILFYF